MFAGIVWFIFFKNDITLTVIMNYSLFIGILYILSVTYV